jgi:hypothetical protein
MDSSAICARDFHLVGGELDAEELRGDLGSADGVGEVRQLGLLVHRPARLFGDVEEALPELLLQRARSSGSRATSAMRLGGVAPNVELRAAPRVGERCR